MRSCLRWPLTSTISLEHKIENKLKKKSYKKTMWERDLPPLWERYKLLHMGYCPIVNVLHMLFIINMVVMCEMHESILFSIYKKVFWYISLPHMNRMRGATVNVFASSMVDRGFDSQSGQTKNYYIGIFCF